MEHFLITKLKFYEFLFNISCIINYRMVYFLEFCEKEFKLVNLEYLSQIKRFHKILQREFFYVKRLLKLIRI